MKTQKSEGNFLILLFLELFFLNFIHFPFAATITRCWMDALNVVLQCRNTLCQLIEKYVHTQGIPEPAVIEILFKSQNSVILLGTKRPGKSARIFLH